MPRNASFVFCAIVLFAASFSPASTFQFKSPTTISTGTTKPAGFALGDFNGDGKADIAIPDSLGKTVTIYLNAGGGAFGAPIVTTLNIDNTLGETILAGDVNEDGKSDLLVATVAGDQYAIVLLSNGNGTFTVQPPIPGSFGFFSGEISDLNADGHLDLFLGANGSVWVFLGKGDGTFSPQPIPRGSFPGTFFGVTTGDFNGDHHVDGIAEDVSGPNSSGYFNFFAGDGFGKFANATLTQPPTIFQMVSIDSADINHDGKLDLLVSSGNQAYVVLGNGDGSFQVAENQVRPIPALVPPLNTFMIAQAADLDKDGKPDIVLLDVANGRVELFLNDGSATFPDGSNPPYVLQVHRVSNHVETADLNGDGLPDFVVSNFNDKTMTIFLSGKDPVLPTVNLSGGNGSSLVSAPLTFNVSISGGTTVATGVVSLMDAGLQISQKTLDAAGTAVFDISSLAVGTHSFTVSYSGDANFLPATSTSISQSATDFHVGVSPSSQTIAAGSSTSYTLNVSPDGGFSGTVAVTCSGLPQLASCKAASIDVTNAPGTVTVTVATTATTTAGMTSKQNLIFACGMIGFFSLCCVPRGSRRILLRTDRILPLVLFVLVVGMSACGGGGSSNSSPPRTIPGTPAGTTSITINASATQNGVTVTHSATASLTVK